MLYQHTNKKDKLLRSFEGKDIYLSTDSKDTKEGWTIIIRHSSEAGDYESYSSHWFTPENMKKEKFQQLALVALQELLNRKDLKND